MHRLVIARYAETVDWVSQVPPAFDIVIYNKGAPITAPAVLSRARVVARANAGREGETYLAHIASQLHSSGAGFTVFAQGDPFEHSPDILSLLTCTHAWRDVQPLSWRWKIARDIPPAALLRRETGGFVAGLRVRPELFSLASWAPLGFDDPGAQWLNSTYRELHDVPAGTNIAAHFLELCGLASLAQAALLHRAGEFSYGAVFAVRTARLAMLPPAPLRRMAEACCAHSVYGYVLERLWLHAFGAPFHLPLGPAPHEAARPPPATAPFHPPEAAAALRRRHVARLARRVSRLVAGA